MKTEKYNQEVRAMKFRHIKDIDGFFEAVGSCKGRVELVTDEGDRLEPEIQADPVFGDG